jgi:Pyruvate/2-oxoacid:ferredoxin oxidoreductase delta subunit
VEWCVEPYTYSICCCCPCCCVTRLLRFDRGIKSGVMRSCYLPRFDGAKCTSCEKCTSICPGSAITVSPTGRTVDPEKCVGCGLCEHLCPSAAIELYEAYPQPEAIVKGLFHHYLIYVSTYFVLGPHFIMYMLLKHKKRERARDVEW